MWYLVDSIHDQVKPKTIKLVLRKYYTENYRLCATRTPLKRGELRCSERVSSWCSSCDTRRSTIKRHKHHLIGKSSWTPVCVNKYKEHYQTWTPDKINRRLNIFATLQHWCFRYRMVVEFKKSLKIPKVQAESIYRRTHNTMAKRKSTKGQTTINKTYI